MAIKKSALYTSLWKSCDELRGGMDGSQYKDYILTLLFVKYVSDKCVGEKFPTTIIPEGCSFDDIVALIGQKEIGDKINKIIAKLAEENDLKCVINIADFNDEDKLGKGKEIQDRLSNLVAIFNDLDLRNNRAEGDDLLGDAYEYLIRHFATESGKSKGQFYTPAEVSRIMAKIIGINEKTRQDQTVYDPTCGSGSLLLKAADEAPRGLSIYGQEKDVTTTALAKMNMILHDRTADIAVGGSSTLSDPAFAKSGVLKKFDFVVANPPFSSKSWDNGFVPKSDDFNRFEYGIPPAKNGDYAFFLHLIHSLKSNGKGAIVLPHGVLFRGNAESNIRQQIINRGYIKGIIGLPANLFYGTGIPACIIVIDKEQAEYNKGIFMIDASRDFVKDGNKNRLRSQDLHKIVTVFNTQQEIAGYSRLVPVAEVAGAKNDYNLNLPRYIDSVNEADTQDLIAHLKGGIPKRDIDELAHYWEKFPSVWHVLFKESANPEYFVVQIPHDTIKTTILEADECKLYTKDVIDVLDGWKANSELCLKDLKPNCKPKDVIRNISEDLLAQFGSISLLDKYDIYQYLMQYWEETMQDDVYQISAEGWKKAAELRLLMDGKGKDKTLNEAPDIKVGTGKSINKFMADLIPPALIVARYYEGEQKVIDSLEAGKETIGQEFEECIEENSWEEGLLENVKNDKGKIIKTSINERIKEIKRSIGFDEEDDELKILKKILKLMDKESEFTKEIGIKQRALNEKLVFHYKKLSEDDIKILVIHDKWFARLTADIQGEIDRIVQSLASRVKELEERYACPMPELVRKVNASAIRVDEHLKKMGLCW